MKINSPLVCFLFGFFLMMINKVLFFFILENQIRGIDTDEAQFLDEIDRVRYVQELKKKREEKKEIEEYKISFCFNSFF